MDNEKMGIFIREKRKDKNLNQKQLAALMQVSPATVCKWEKGINIPDISNLDKLADLLQVPMQEILNGGVKEAPSADLPRQQTADTAPSALI